MNHHRSPDPAATVKLSVTPPDAGWDYLSFAVVELEEGATHTSRLDDQETAIVPLRGRGVVTVGGHSWQVGRTSVFEEMPHVAYAPPGEEIGVVAEGDFEFAIGSAPAEGRYPPRLFSPSEMTSELRGGGAAHRQVNHVLAAPLPAERLILYEVYVPRGTWSGWPPHCHDGRDGSPYLEETYYFRLDRPEGYAIHRNWRDDEGFDEAVVAYDGDVVLVPKGYHTSVACPGSNMFFLNYLAGELVDDERATPPCFHADHTWIEADWTAGEWGLPVVT